MYRMLHICGHCDNFKGCEQNVSQNNEDQSYFSRIPSPLVGIDEGVETNRWQVGRKGTNSTYGLSE